MITSRKSVAALINSAFLIASFLCMSLQVHAAEQQRAPIAAWTDAVNAPGEYKSGQEVCDGKIAWGYPFALTFVANSALQPNADGQCMYGPMPHQWAANPMNGFFCPAGFVAQDIGYSTTWGSEPYNHIPQFKGPNAYCVRVGVDRGKNAGQCPTCVGNPINVGTGNKWQIETDYQGTGLFPLSFSRAYNSLAFDANSRIVGPSIVAVNVTVLGSKWTHNYNRAISVDTNGIRSSATIARADGKTFYFTSTSGGAWLADSDVSDRLERLTDGGGVHTGWRYTTRADEVELYDTAGKLLSTTNRSGLIHTLTYSDGSTSPSIAPVPGLLIRVSDSFGKQLNFTYDSSKRINTMTNPAGGVYRYSYSTNYNLTSVAYPDATPANQADDPTRVYWYENGSFPNNLTGITDENAIRYATFGYNSNGLATLSEHAGGVERVTLAYSSNTVVTDALNTARTYNFQMILGVLKNTTRIEPCVSGCTTSTTSRSYDANGNPASRTDANGNQTTYVYDLARNLETSRTEAFGTAKARTITTQWHATYRTPTQIDEPGKRTTFTHYPNGDVQTVTVLDTALSTSRATTYTYNATGQVLTINGPRTDVSDVTTYTYYSCTTGYQCGQVNTITNALGRVTTFNTYNAHGQPLTITDPNNLVTTLTYDERQRLTSRTVGTEITSMEYWPTGLIKKVTLPHSSFLSYGYDNAHRLTSMTDSEGNQIVYTLDLMGNRTTEEKFDPSLALTQTRTAVFNALSQLSQDIAAAGTPNVTTTFGYDNNGNQTTTNAPMGRNSINAYDELNRLKQVTDPINGNTVYGYNALDQLISVTDPKNLITNYTYNALGDLLTQVSPDTGTTINTYDTGGNLKTKKDARNKTLTYTYDALNRVTQEAHVDKTVTYGYDSGANAIGRLTSEADSTHNTTFGYDSLGRLTTKTQTVGTVVKTVGYSFNSVGQLQSTTTPYGAVIGYTYTQGKVTGVTVNGTNVVTNILYEPFGPTSGWTWGNGTLAVRVFDTDGKLTQIDSAGLKTYQFDDAFRITGQTDTVTPANSWTYGYDNNDRLTSALNPTNTQGFTYDADGNRLTQTGTTAATLTYPATSNKLSGITGGLTRTYTYDLAGNITNDGTIVYTYYNNGRVKTAKNGAASAVTYTYNAFGQRIKKTGTTRYFVYDEAGHLLGEYNSSGTMVYEYVWLGDIPVAVLKPKTGGVDIFYIHTDHLNTPRKITTSAVTPVTRWTYNPDPFGKGGVNENPSGAGTFVFNLRFPGQYFDSETGNHYNYYRDYDPATGRYVESDPIGLEGGINTYTYTSGNPVMAADPYGLIKVDLFGPKETALHDAVASYKDDPNRCLVYAHGLPGFVSDRRAGSAKLLGVKDLTALLLAFGCKPEMPVELYSCDTGYGENSIAEQLAKYFKSVTAPDKWVWFEKNPNANGPTLVFDSVEGRVNPKGKGTYTMDRNNPGNMRVFH